MKKIISKLLIWLHKKIVWREPCILYRRLFKYNKWVKDWYKSNCPFCEDIWWEIYWNFSIIKNKYPYTNTKEHWLVIPHRHIIWIWALNEKELRDLQYILTKYMNKGYMILGRQYWAHPESSVEHFHLHLIK